MDVRVVVAHLAYSRRAVAVLLVYSAGDRWEAEMAAGLDFRAMQVKEERKGLEAMDAMFLAASTAVVTTAAVVAARQVAVSLVAKGTAVRSRQGGSCIRSPRLRTTGRTSRGPAGCTTATPLRKSSR